MIKAEKNISTVGNEIRQDGLRTVIQGPYKDIINLTVDLLVEVSKALSGSGKEEQADVLQALYLTARDVIAEDIK